MLCALQAPGRRKRQLSDSDSDTDESVVSSVELKRAKTDAAFWRRRYTEACQEKAKLTNIIESMQRTSDGKLAASEYHNNYACFVVAHMVSTYSFFLQFNSC